MHIRLRFRSHLKFKLRDTLKGNNPGVGRPGRKGTKISSEVFLDSGEKSLVYIIRVPVLQTDTGSQEENSKANGRRIVKELGKLTP